MDVGVGNRWRGASVIASARVTADRVAFCLGAVAFSLSAVVLWDAVHEVPAVAPGPRAVGAELAVHEIAVGASNPLVERSSVHAFYRGGQIVLEGSVPDVATHRRVRSMIDAVVAEGAVADRLTIEAGAGAAPASIRIPIGEMFDPVQLVMLSAFEPVIDRLGDALQADGDTVVVLDGRGATLGAAAVESVRAQLSAIGVEPARILDAADIGMPGPVATTETVVLTVVPPT